MREKLEAQASVATLKQKNEALEHEIRQYKVGIIFDEIFCCFEENCNDIYSKYYLHNLNWCLFNVIVEYFSYIFIYYLYLQAQPLSATVNLANIVVKILYVASLKH